MHLTTGEDGTYPNWEWNDLDPAMEFKLIFVPRVIQRVWSQFVSATSRFVPTSLNGKHVEPAVKQIVTEHAMRAATGDEATLFYKVMKYLQLLFFVVAILSIPLVAMVSVVSLSYCRRNWTVDLHSSSKPYPGSSHNSR